MSTYKHTFVNELSHGMENKNMLDVYRRDEPLETATVYDLQVTNKQSFVDVHRH